MQGRIWQDQCVFDRRFSPGQTADSHAYWFGARNHRRQYAQKKGKSESFFEAREEGKENMAQVAR